MQTTHVGSLPFKSVDQALNYTFKWDVPVLFTLPQMSSQEFMGADLTAILDIGEISSNGEVILKKDYFKSSKKVLPFHFDAFIKLKDHNKINKFKYQLIGPVTLYQIISNREEIDFDDLVKFLKDKYFQLIKKLSLYGDLVFVIDEPLLKHNLNFYENDDFIKELEALGAEVYLHCCDKLNYKKLGDFKKDLHLDMGLFPNELMNFMIVSDFIGLEKPDSYHSFFAAEKLKVKAHFKYISPSCGLGISRVDEMLSLPESFKNLAAKINLQDHQN